MIGKCGSFAQRFSGAYAALGASILGEASGDRSGTGVSMSDDGTVVAIGSQSGSPGLTSGAKGHARVFDWSGSAWTQRGSTIVGEAAYDLFGYHLELSGNGNVLAVGAFSNDGNGSSSGHVRVFEWSGSAWTQRGSDIDGEAAGDESGWAVSINQSGSRVAIGSRKNDGTGTNAGSVRVYDWNGTAWGQVGADIDGEAAGDLFGVAVSLSSDGNTLVVGAPENDDGGADAGSVRVFYWSGSAWTQRGSDIDGAVGNASAGYSVSVSGDGLRFATGYINETGGAFNSGVVRVYDWSGSSWVQAGNDIDGAYASSYFGVRVSISKDGRVLAVGGHAANSGDGYASVYQFSGSSWVQLGTDFSSVGSGDGTGWGVAVNSDGSVLAVGSQFNDDGGSNAGKVDIYSLEYSKLT